MTRLELDGWLGEVVEGLKPYLVDRVQEEVSRQLHEVVTILVQDEIRRVVREAVEVSIAVRNNQAPWD